MAVSREPEFRTTRMREGYDLDAVDDFVDLVIDALDGRGRGITPEQIENEEFKVVRMREGYVMDDVDDWLDSAAAELRRIRKAQHGQQPQAAQAAQAAQQPYGAPPNPVGAAPMAPPVMPPPVTQQHLAPPVTAPPMPSPSMAPPPMSPAPMAPPAVSQGYGSPGLPTTPSASPSYPGYYDPEPAQHTQVGYGTSHAAPAAQPAYDPLTDSAVSELDPVLRALDPAFGAGHGGHQDPYASGPGTTRAHEPQQVADDQSLSPSTTPSTGLHHVEIWVRDLDAATRSFGWLFERLGWTLFQAWENGRSWQAPGGGPYVVIECSPDLSWVAYDRKAPGLNHLALAVPEQWMVDRIVSEAPAYGWHLMFADRHPHAGGPHHYAAYMENDEGYEVEVVAP